jgi:hypothetical protein
MNRPAAGGALQTILPHRGNEMNSATRVLNNYVTGTDGTSEVAADRLLLTVAAVAMASSDDDVRPMTATIAYLESILPGSVAIQRLRGRWAGTLTAEAQR